MLLQGDCTTSPLLQFLDRILVQHTHRMGLPGALPTQPRLLTGKEGGPASTHHLQTHIYLMTVREVQPPAHQSPGSHKEGIFSTLKVSEDG